MQLKLPYVMISLHNMGEGEVANLYRVSCPISCLIVNTGQRSDY